MANETDGNADRYGLHEPLADHQYDALVAAAAQQLGTPISTISIVEARRQWFKARIGLDVVETPIEESFCARVVEQDGVMVVPDATVDPRFHDYPNVTGGTGIRFYAGAPLTMRDGTRIGTICVIDTKPRDGLDAQEQATLVDLARRTVAAIEMRVDLRAAGRQPTERAQWLDQAGDHLMKAWVALDLLGATAELARLEQVIVEVDALRST
ncbi:GAF domain-containing protein [Sphingomonas insulae]|nr:GAF domain-containing protein [Sphingomonas insulae]NIJ30546.1 GAF domain-containing protein [Sphingomonas insulae]